MGKPIDEVSEPAFGSLASARLVRLKLRNPTVGRSMLFSTPAAALRELSIEHVTYIALSDPKFSFFGETTARRILAQCPQLETLHWTMRASSNEGDCMSEILSECPASLRRFEFTWTEARWRDANQEVIRACQRTAQDIGIFIGRPGRLPALKRIAVRKPARVNLYGDQWTVEVIERCSEICRKRGIVFELVDL